jgi:hypothetical protein
MAGGKNGKKAAFGRAARAMFAAMACLLALSCGGPSSAEKKAERERREQAKREIAGLESKLERSGQAGRTELLRSIMAIQVMRLGELSSALDLYAKEEKLLSADVQARVYAAVAEAMTAGKVKKIEDKLKWLRKGMSSFEALLEEYPDEEFVYLYQASTYANFPREVGAKDEVLDIVAAMAERYRSGGWSLDDGAAGQLDYIYENLKRNFPDAASGIEAHRAATAAALPAYAARLEKAGNGSGS